MSGALKLILEMGEPEEETVECPKCGAEVETEDKYCCDCGAKMPAPTKAVAAARKDSLSKMASMTEED